MTRWRQNKEIVYDLRRFRSWGLTERPAYFSSYWSKGAPSSDVASPWSRKFYQYGTGTGTYPRRRDLDRERSRHQHNFNGIYPAFQDIEISGNTIQSLSGPGPLHGRRRERPHAGHLWQSFHQLCCGATNGPAASLSRLPLDVGGRLELCARRYARPKPKPTHLRGPGRLFIKQRNHRPGELNAAIMGPQDA
jgi:hypothetical protein